MSDLVDHVACQVGQAYEDHAVAPPADMPADKLPAWRSHQDQWAKLYTYSFVGAVDLTLAVTNTDSAGYTYNWVTALTGNGKSARPYIYSGMGSTSATNNRTLALGLQVNGIQDRNVEQDYNLDVRRIVDAYEKQEVIASIQSGQPNEHNPKFPFCAPRAHGPSLGKRLESQLQGNLALPETIEDGLIALDRSSAYNIYGSAGPTRFVDIIGAPQAFIAHGPAGGTGMGTGGSSSSGGASSGKNSFASKVDFAITDGIGGGPTYALLVAKLSAGSGGGSGGGGQPLSFSRMTQDSFTVTFGPTCMQPKGEEPGTLATFSPMLPPIVPAPAAEPAAAGAPDALPPPAPAAPPPTVLGITVAGTTPTRGDDGPYTFAFTLSAAAWMSAQTVGAAPTMFAAGSVSSQGPDRIILKDDKGLEIAEGAVSWTGYIRGDGQYDLRGIVKSQITGNTVGQIWLAGNTKDILAQGQAGTITIKHMPFGLLTHLTDDTPDKDYWSTVPGCDAVTAGQVQAVQDDLQNKTLLQTYLRQ